MRYGIEKLSFIWGIMIVYSGASFILTWAINFFNFKFIQDLFGIKVTQINAEGEFWGLAVLSEDDLMTWIIMLTMFLVLGVIGYRSIKDLTSAHDFENELDSLDINNIADFQKAENKKLETALLVIAEE
jgi:hypothetical protein